MRLIDADALLCALALEPMENRTYWRANEIVLDQPTAYDIEDIIKQLEKERERQRENAIDRNYRFGVVNGLNVVIGILKDNIPTADVVEVVRCTECAMHSKCIMEDTFKTVGITDGYCRVGRKVEKMTVTDYCTVSCEECMKDAPYEYCCKLECGEHEFCRRCQKSDCCSLIISMNGIDKGR